MNDFLLLTRSASESDYKNTPCKQSQKRLENTLILLPTAPKLQETINIASIHLAASHIVHLSLMCPQLVLAIESMLSIPLAMWLSAMKTPLRKVDFRMPLDITWPLEHRVTQAAIMTTVDRSAESRRRVRNGQSVLVLFRA